MVTNKPLHVHPMLLAGNILSTGLWPAIYLLLVALAPVIFFTWLIHFFDQQIQGRLSRRFGWNSVLVTGWIGTPIHELSHALMCIVFQHKIIEMELFKPDRKNGRLGYVIHSSKRGSLYSEIGNFFIGVAPLVGGTTILFLLLVIFYPDVGRNSLFATPDELPLWSQVGTALQKLFAGLFEVSNLASVRLWLFLYLVICVGSHMAPSLPDYRGGIKGGILLLILLFLISILISVFNPDTATLLTFARPILVPVITIMVTVIILCLVATIVVFAITELLDRIQSR